MTLFLSLLILALPETDTHYNQMNQQIVLEVGVNTHVSGVGVVEGNVGIVVKF